MKVHLYTKTCLDSGHRQRRCYSKVKLWNRREVSVKNVANMYMDTDDKMSFASSHIELVVEQAGTISVPFHVRL